MMTILEPEIFHATRPGVATTEPLPTETSVAKATRALPSAETVEIVAERCFHSLDELQRLAELFAVEDSYEPTTRDFVIPRNFKLSIVIPVYNEERTIQQVLAHVVSLAISKE